jgi:lipopolysaccharide assembly outer membrane protein LptD (OstA)
MKLFILGAVAACHFTSIVPEAICQQADEKIHLTTGPVRLEAASIQREVAFPSVIRLKGQVEIQTKIIAQKNPLALLIMTVTADEADYHEDTGEIEARGKVRVDYRDDPSQTKAGNVRIKLEPIRP